MSAEPSEPPALTDAQLISLRQALLRRREELEHVLALSKDGSAPVDLDQPIGRLSRMEAMQQQQMVRASRSAQEAELRRVSVALADMDSGDYGHCRECDEPIPYRRLEIRPDTRICVTCQQRREG